MSSNTFCFHKTNNNKLYAISVYLLGYQLTIEKNNKFNLIKFN